MPGLNFIDDLIKIGLKTAEKIPASLQKPRLSGKEFGKAIIEDSKLHTGYTPSKFRESGTELLPGVELPTKISKPLKIEDLKKQVDDEWFENVLSSLKGKGKIAGAGFAAGATMADWMNPEEAEAIPLQKIFKGAEKLAKVTGEKISRREFLKLGKEGLDFVHKEKTLDKAVDLLDTAGYDLNSLGYDIYSPQHVRASLKDLPKDFLSAKELQRFKKINEDAQYYLSKLEEEHYLDLTEKEYQKLSQELNESYPEVWPETYLTSMILKKLKPTQAQLESAFEKRELASLKRLSDYKDFKVMSGLTPEEEARKVASYKVHGLLEEFTPFQWNERGQLKIRSNAPKEWIEALGTEAEDLLKGGSNVLEKGLQKNVSRREFLTGSWLKRLGKLGAAGTVGSQVLSPEESEAMPLGTIRKLSKTILKSSSAEHALKGTVLGERVVKGVKKGSKDWRIVQFEDGHEIPMTKDYLNDLMRAVGTKKYLKEFGTQPKTGKQSMAARSLETRLDRSEPLDPIKYAKEHKAHQERVKDIASNLGIDPGLLTTKTVFVRWPANDPNARVVQMPLEYAEILAKEGQVTIIREGAIK